MTTTPEESAMAEVKAVAWSVLAERIEWLKAFSDNGAYRRIQGPSAGNAYDLALELEQLQSDHERAVAELRAQLDVAKRALEMVGEIANTQRQRAERAEAQVAELQRDARRYAWLRDPDNMDGPNLVATLGKDELDAAIDALLDPPA